jgi:hypothetical protein
LKDGGAAGVFSVAAFLGFLNFFGADEVFFHLFYYLVCIHENVVDVEHFLFFDV